MLPNDLDLSIISGLTYIEETNEWEFREKRYKLMSVTPVSQRGTKRCRFVSETEEEYVDINREGKVIFESFNWLEYSPKYEMPKKEYLKKKYEETKTKKNPRVCPVCGTVFYKRAGTIFCSTKCQQRWNFEQRQSEKHASLPTATCPVCKKLFLKTTERKKYCSIQCKNKAWRKDNPELCKQYDRKAKALKSASKIKELVCPECGKTFLTTNPMQKFCCKECYSAKEKRREQERYKMRKARGDFDKRN